MESNPLSLSFKTNSEAAKYGAKLAGDIGCDSGDMNCLRNASFESIVNVQDNIFIIPGNALPKIISHFLDPFRTNLLDIILTWAPTIDGTTSSIPSNNSR
jgi:carboxylesterase type B